jgi:hypothetical protein
MHRIRRIPRSHVRFLLSLSLSPHKTSTRVSIHYTATFSTMKLSLLLLSLLPLFALARNRREDAKEQHERPEQQYIRRVQVPQVPSVSCANGAFRFDW